MATKNRNTTNGKTGKRIERNQRIMRQMIRRTEQLTSPLDVLSVINDNTP